MKFSKTDRVVIDPDGNTHYNPRVYRYSYNLKREHFLPMICIGIILIGLAGYFAYRSISFANSAHKVFGTVVDYSQIVSNKSTSYAPIVKFKTESGQSIEFTSSVSSSSKTGVGSKVPVLYDAEDPNNAVIDNIMDRFGISIILFIFGVMLSITAIIARVWNPGAKSVLNIDGKEWSNDTGAPIGYTNIKTKFSIFSKSK
jgi:Protein of unknown function (DUF3592)